MAQATTYRSYQPVQRLRSKQKGPLRSVNNYQFGFYDIGILRQALEANPENAIEYRTATLPIPQNETEFAKAKQYIEHPLVQYALVDKKKLVLVLVEGAPGWLSVFNDLGYHVKGGAKTAKRMKSFHRPTLLNAEYENLNIHIVEPTAYTRYDFEDDSEGDDSVAEFLRQPEVVERLLDGCFVISSRLMPKAIANLPVYEPHNSSDTEEYYFDPHIRHKLQQFLANSKVFNARLFYKDGCLKGNMIVSDKLPEGVDVISSRANLKTEITYDNGFRLLAEPQGPKSKVVTDDQTVINFPKLFRKSDMELWLREEYEKMFQDAINNKLLQNWKSIYTRVWKDDKDVEDPEIQARMSYVAYRWISAGMKITDSPWLFENLAISHAKPLEKRIPIPCAVYEQIIPESIARMAGYDIEVEELTIVRLNEIGVHVVNDLDWLEMYESHGGHDADDFFRLIYREVEGGDLDGEKVVIVIRSPNGKGEYSVFRYVEGQWSPSWLMSDGTKIKFPKINGRGWPIRLSTAIRANHVRYLGLPSTHTPSTAPKSENYDQNQVLADLRAAMGGGNVGRFVNVSMLYSSVFPKHRSVQLCSLEDAIDGCTQTSVPEDRMAIDEETLVMFNEIIKSGRPIDRALWYSRHLYRMLGEGQTVELYDGKITQLYKLCDDYHKAYCKRVVDWAQENARPSEIVHNIGRRLYFHALPYLNRFRMDIYNINNSQATQLNGVVQADVWEDLYDGIVNKIQSFDRIQDQHDFVLALYSCTIKVKTKGGKLTDQIVMNRKVFPLLEKALQHYGIAKRTLISRSEDGSIDIQQSQSVEWSYPDEDGKLHSFKDILEYQKFHAKYSPVIHTTSNKAK